VSRRVVGLLLAALALATAGCGSSSKPTPQDTAHSNGEAVGRAAKELLNAGSLSDVASAVVAMQTALENVKKNVKDSGGQVQAQVTAQEQRLSKAFHDAKAAANNADFSGLVTATSEMESDLKDLDSQAQNLALSSDSVARAFWDGVQDGYDKG
jgi:hypothetical protein